MAANGLALVSTEARDALGRAYASFDSDESAARFAGARGLVSSEGVDVFADDVAAGVAAGSTSLGRAGAFARWLGELDGGRAAGLLMCGRVAEAQGQVAVARALATAAVAADGDFGPARWDVAWHAAVRDKYDVARDWLAPLDVDDEDPDLLQWTIASRWHGRGPNDASRCHCGSDRDSARCCGSNGLELTLTWWKLRSFQFRAAQRAVVIAVAAALARVDTAKGWLTTQEVDRLSQALANPLASLLALVRGGGVKRYVDVWGSVVSPAERAALDLIAAASIAVWVPATDGGSLRSLDGRTVLAIRNPQALSAVDGTGCLIAAVTPWRDGDEAYIVGDVVGLRSSAIGGPPIEVAAALRGQRDPVALARALAGLADGLGHELFDAVTAHDAVAGVSRALQNTNGSSGG